ESAEGQSEPASLLRRQIVRRPATGPPRQGARQAECGFSTRAKAAIERKYNSGWRSGVGAIDQHDRQRCSIIFDKPILDVSRTPRKAQRQPAKGARLCELGGGRRDNYSGGIEVRQPHDAGAVGAEARIGGEIATPSAGRQGRRVPDLFRLYQR